MIDLYSFTLLFQSLILQASSNELQANRCSRRSSTNMFWCCAHEKAVHWSRRRSTTYVYYVFDCDFFKLRTGNVYSYHLHYSDSGKYIVLLNALAEIRLDSHRQYGRHLKILITTNNMNSMRAFDSESKDFDFLLFEYENGVREGNQLARLNQPCLTKLADAKTVVCLHSDLFRLRKWVDQLKFEVIYCSTFRFYYNRYRANFDIIFMHEANEASSIAPVIFRPKAIVMFGYLQYGCSTENGHLFHWMHSFAGNHNIMLNL